MSIIIKDLDEYEFSENIEESLREDNISESCYTNFKDLLVETLIHEIRESVEEDGWKLKAFEKNKEDKIFDAFMNNGEIKVLLSKKNGELKKVIVKLDFSENEKKKIAETYVNTVLEGYYYLDLCLFTSDDEDDNDEDGEINVDTTAKILSREVYGILSPDEIKAKFKDKIEEAIKIVFNANNDDIEEE